MQRPPGHLWKLTAFDAQHPLQNPWVHAVATNVPNSHLRNRANGDAQRGKRSHVAGGQLSVAAPDRRRRVPRAHRPLSHGRPQEPLRRHPAPGDDQRDRERPLLPISAPTTPTLHNATSTFPTVPITVKTAGPSLPVVHDANLSARHTSQKGGRF